jgi:ElaB/YqjD/DUF883 family membrane-anchored ribosome-binding protein
LPRARRVPGLAALLAVLFLCTLALPTAATAGKAPPPPPPPEFFGLVPQGGMPTNADLARMRQAKVGTARLVADWRLVEPHDDAWNFGSLDAYVGNLAAAGIRPFPVFFHATPFVSSDDRRLPVHSVQAEEQWREFVARVVQRYRAGGEYWSTAYPIQHPGAQPLPVTAWQLWNEQNGPKHAHYPNPTEYAELLKITHEAIASRDPAADLVLGGMFGTPTGEGGIEAWDFLSAIYASPGAKESFDAIALHPYSPDIEGIKEQVNKMRKVVKKNADERAKNKLKKAKAKLKLAKRTGPKAKINKARKRVKRAKRGLQQADIWVTEIGWGSEGASTSRLVKGLEGQATLLRKSFELFEKQRKKWKIASVLWYTWRDVNRVGAPCDWCATAGLFRQDGVTAKPALSEFVRLTGGS